MKQKSDKVPPFFKKGGKDEDDDDEDDAKAGKSEKKKALPKFSEWVAAHEAACADDGKPHAPHGMKKASYSEKMSGKARDIGKEDLSKDYKGHVAANGTVEPFEVVKKGKKS